MLSRWRASLAKEIRLILRDREALALLFVMPIVFVVIMSLALQQPFKDRAGAVLPVLVVNEDRGVVGEELEKYFQSSPQFRASVHRIRPVTLERDVHEGKFRFAVVVVQDTTARAVRRVQQQLNAASKSKPEPPVAVEFLSDPAMLATERALIVSALNRALQSAESAIVLRQINEASRQLKRAREMFPEVPSIKAPARLQTFVEVGGSSDPHASARLPTSAQQHVPAWTLLAMFFLVVPLSIAFIKERQQGSLLRLRSLRTPMSLIVGGKVVPYLVINQLQMMTLLAAGVYLLPWLGGERLAIGESLSALALMSVASNLAAIGFGFLIASFARTTEQATVFGPMSVLILAGLGGVLVPRMVMPQVMQQVGFVSPFAWALDGFHDVFVRSGDVSAVWPEAAGLLIFGAACFAFSLWRFRRAYKN